MMKPLHRRSRPMHQRKETAPRRSANVVHGKEPIPTLTTPFKETPKSQRDSRKPQKYREHASKTPH